MDKTKQLALLTAVAILAVLAGGWFLLVSPQRSNASDLKQQTSTQEGQNQELQRQIKSLTSQHKDLPQVQAQLAKLGTQLPSNPGLPALIRQLTAAADNAGVDLLSLTPSTPAAVTSGAPTTAKATTTTTTTTAATGSTTPAAPNPAASTQLLAVPINVVVVGGYFQVEQFISNLEALKRSFLTTGLELCPATVGPDNSATCVDTSSTPQDYKGLSMGSVTGKVFMTVKPAAATTPVAPSSAAK
jgi:type IV pilus assembly protein PilO